MSAGSSVSDSGTTGWEIVDLVAGGFGTRLYESGRGNAETIVLVHDGAFGTDALLCWEGILPQLSDYHVLAPDMIGWGGSDKVVYFDRSSYASRLAHILAVVAERAGPSSPLHFVGASFGGSLVLDSWASGLLPQRTRSVTTIGGSAGFGRIDEAFRALGEYEPSLDEARRITSLVVSDLTGLESHIRKRYENSLISGHWEALNAPKLKSPVAVPRPRQPSIEERLAGGVRHPLLLVEGTDDPLLETGWSRRLGEAVGCEHVMIEGAGHEPNIDMPEVLAPILLDFVRRSGEEAR